MSPEIPAEVQAIMERWQVDELKARFFFAVGTGKIDGDDIVVDDEGNVIRQANRPLRIDQPDITDRIHAYLGIKPPQ